MKHIIQRAHHQRSPLAWHLKDHLREFYLRPLLSACGRSPCLASALSLYLVSPLPVTIILPRQPTPTSSWSELSTAAQRSTDAFGNTRQELHRLNRQAQAYESFTRQLLLQA